MWCFILYLESEKKRKKRLADLTLLEIVDE